MFQFQNETFQFDFVLCQVSAADSKTICCHGNRFIISLYMQIVTYSRKIYFLKINFKIFVLKFYYT